MKFLCDRCKTRYSIGDERVRGKILKIRCKHCSNVITVREGMQVDDGSVVGPLPSDPSRPKKSTTIAPEALDERNASGLLNVASLSNAPSIAVAKRTAVAADNALGAAFASAMAPSIAAAAAAEAKAPAALEEEWYVSIDGEQSGPFLLADAQRWIAARPFEADLHCWSEGFDDWLPVDKVSHFRGLRKRPVPPPAPPPAPAPTIPRTISPRASAALSPTTSPGTSVAQAAPSVAKAPSPVAAPASELPPRPNASPAFGTAVAPRSNGAAPLPHATPDERFDDVPAKAPLFVDSGASAAPVAAAPEVATVPTAPPPAVPDDGFTGDDDLDIGEVSRVVNLADLMRNPKPVRRVGGATGANPRLTGSQPALRATGAHPAFRGTGAQPSLSGPIAAPMAPSASGPFAATTMGPGGVSGPVAFPSTGPGLDAQAPGIASPDGVPPVAASHRRGLIALLGVAAVLVIGVIIVLAVFVAPADDTTGGSLGRVNNIDTSRPDDPITHRPTGPTPGPGSGSAVATPTVPHGPIRRPNPPPTRDPEPLPPAADSLRSDEIEDIARKHQDTTQRCYMRSQRGADAILVGDVKKIAVTLQIEKDGSVVDVQLSDHAADTLGKCLATSIRGWKFRTSAGGRFRFSLNFVSG